MDWQNALFCSGLGLVGTEPRPGGGIAARAELGVLRGYRDSPERLIAQQGFVIAIGNYWERIGSLVGAGHIDARLLHDFNGGACPVWWVACEPTIQKLRADYDDPTEYAKFEWLAGVMDTFDANRGASVFDATMLAAQLAHRIGTYEDQMRLDEELW